MDAIPHLTNDAGVSEIRVGAKAFKCVGASPPLDHPHIYLEMGAAEAITCPYCGTRYLHDKALSAASARPASAIYQEKR